MERWLTVRECAMELQVSEDVVKRLLRQGKLAGTMIDRRHGNLRSVKEWRILDPGARLRQYYKELEDHICHVPLVSVQELAAIKGHGVWAIKMAVCRGTLKGQMINGRRYFTLDEVRRHLLTIENRGKLRRVYSRRIVAWAKRMLEDDQTVSSEVMREIFEQANLTAEPQRSQIMTRVFEVADRLADIERLFRSARETLAPVPLSPVPESGPPSPDAGSEPEPPSHKTAP